MKLANKKLTPSPAKEAPLVFTRGHAMWQATGADPAAYLKQNEAVKAAYVRMADDYERLSKQ